MIDDVFAIGDGIATLQSCIHKILSLKSDHIIIYTENRTPPYFYDRVSVTQVSLMTREHLSRSVSTAISDSLIEAGCRVSW